MAMMDTFNGALTLNQVLLQGMREAPDVVRRGLLVVLLVGLIVGGVSGVQTFLGIINPDRELDLLRSTIETALDQQGFSETTPQYQDFLTLFRTNLDSGLLIVKEVTNLPTTLPRPVVALFRALGGMASQPLSYLSGLLFTIAVTHIAARQLGGQGNIQQMVGLGALSVAPHALDALAFIPSLGGFLTTIAWFWGLLVLIVATGVAHRLDSTRATLAVLLYPLIGILLGALGCCLFFGLTLIGARG